MDQGCFDPLLGRAKLTENPLLTLEVVKQTLDDHETTRQCITKRLKTCHREIKTGGERKYTSEWILYNILDLKFLEGKKYAKLP